MLWDKSKTSKEEMEILPINGSRSFSFKFMELSEVTLMDWPPADAKVLGWDEARNEIKRHWAILSSMTIWCPYPILCYSLGSAEAPALVWDSIKNDEFYSTLYEMDNERKNRIHIRFFLFPLKNPRYQNQAVAQVICETKPKVEPGEFRAWVDALEADELTPENLADINTAIRIQ